MTRLASWQDFGTHDESAYPELWRGCVGAWAPCLGPTGTRLHDLSRFRNWGTLTNMDAATDWVVSGGRYALDFDGMDDRVRTLLSSIAMPFSISFWVNSNSLALNQYPLAFCRSGSNDGQFAILLGGAIAGDFVYARQETDAGVVSAAVSTAAYRLNTWEAVTAVFTSDSHRQIYLNGVAGTENTTASTTPTIDRFTLGILDRPSASSPLSGLLDAVMIHNRILSVSEIRTLCTRRGIAFEPRKRRSVFFDAAFFNPAWARNSNVILSPVGAA